MAEIPTPSLPGEQFAAAAASLFKLVDAVVAFCNTPEMMAAREREDVKAILKSMDDTLKAAQAGDAEARAKIDSEVSG